jgi:hypothetical protein
LPTIVKRTALAANGTASPLAGEQYEYLPFDAQVEIAISSDANGVLATVYSGTDLLQKEGPVQLGTINVMPKYPDDFFLTDVAAAGEKLTIDLRDTSAAARVVMTVVRLTPI